MISRGSEWHRWEPHIHAPGTVLNNQFGHTDPWETYFTTLENLTPQIEAISVTDYYVTDTYEEFLKHKAAGRFCEHPSLGKPGRSRASHRGDAYS